MMSSLTNWFQIEEKKDLLVKATDYHARSYKKAMVGEGIDRHLFCLYVMSKYLKIESEFLNRVLHEPWRLSTSQTPSQQTGKVDYNKNPNKMSGGGGFGPVSSHALNPRLLMELCVSPVGCKRWVWSVIHHPG